MVNGSRKPDWCESRVGLPSYPDTLYRRESRQMMYVGAKYPHWCPDFRRAEAGFAIATTSKRLDLLDIVQYLHLAASDFAMRCDNGRLHVYARGSFGPSTCVPSEELLATCKEYACSSEGLSLLTRFGDCSGDIYPLLRMKLQIRCTWHARAQTPWAPWLLSLRFRRFERLLEITRAGKMRHLGTRRASQALIAGFTAWPCAIC